ncbi:MAG: hypothetical protein NC133_01290 [Prevotella sp.]|nr:hypothetical protein [Prevotella sp.]
MENMENLENVQQPAQQPEQKSDWNLKGFNLDMLNGGEQVILAHKQINPQDHLVVTCSSEQKNAKLKCFKLSHLEGEKYHAVEYVSPEKIAEFSRLMMGEEKQQ